MWRLCRCTLSRGIDLCVAGPSDSWLWGLFCKLVCNLWIVNQSSPGDADMPPDLHAVSDVICIKSQPSTHSLHFMLASIASSVIAALLSMTDTTLFFSPDWNCPAAAVSVAQLLVFYRACCFVRWLYVVYQLKLTFLCPVICAVPAFVYVVPTGRHKAGQQAGLKAQLLASLPWWKGAASEQDSQGKGRLCFSKGKLLSSVFGWKGKAGGQDSQGESRLCAPKDKLLPTFFGWKGKASGQDSSSEGRYCQHKSQAGHP